MLYSLSQAPDFAIHRRVKASDGAITGIPTSRGVNCRGYDDVVINVVCEGAGPGAIDVDIYYKADHEDKWIPDGDGPLSWNLTVSTALRISTGGRTFFCHLTNLSGWDCIGVEVAGVIPRQEETD